MNHHQIHFHQLAEHARREAEQRVRGHGSRDWERIELRPRLRKRR